MGISHNIYASDGNIDEYSPRSTDAMKAIEQRVTIDEILKELKSNISPQVVVAFENFLKEPEINERIEQESDRHRFSGSTQAYQDSMRKVAEESFLEKHVSIDGLMKIHEHIFSSLRSQQFREKIAQIMEGESLKLVTFSDRLAKVSDEKIQLLSDIEDLHLSEIEEEEMDQYSMKNTSERLTFWEQRLFPTDLLYQRIKASKA